MYDDHESLVIAAGRSYRFHYTAAAAGNSTRLFRFMHPVLKLLPFIAIAHKHMRESIPDDPS
jgi:hypothetical protein